MILVELIVQTSSTRSLHMRAAVEGPRCSISGQED
jgi:hypothetical protein